MRLYLDTNILVFLATGQQDEINRDVDAQALSDHTALVSSDRQFQRYERYGLQLIFNER